ncbi:MAG: hypothetical protein PHT07_14835 [Paludibacter sp.]|nr:hypothetical protein [Paludibacter sp.]
MNFTAEIGKERELFDPETFKEICAACLENVRDCLKTAKKPVKHGKGGIVVNNVSTIEYGNKYVWLEFSWSIEEKESGTKELIFEITRCTIFDEVPNELLDRYNMIKKLEKLHNGI